MPAERVEADRLRLCTNMPERPNSVNSEEVRNEVNEEPQPFERAMTPSFTGRVRLTHCSKLYTEAKQEDQSEHTKSGTRPIIEKRDRKRAERSQDLVDAAVGSGRVSSSACGVCRLCSNKPPA